MIDKETIRRVIVATIVNTGMGSQAEAEGWVESYIDQVMVAVGEGRPSITDLDNAMNWEDDK